MGQTCGQKEASSHTWGHQAISNPRPEGKVRLGWAQGKDTVPRRPGAKAPLQWGSTRA